MATNDFLPFCATDTGTNLETQADYLVDSDRTQGNQPGVAKSKLVNKALRQATYVSGLLAQLASNTTGADAQDDATPAEFLALLQATLSFYSPTVTRYTSGSGNHNLTYLFFIASGSATAGATYTNNAITFTVKSTVSLATMVSMSGSGDPLVSGTLTKASGTGDNTLTFYAFRKPLSLRVTMVGGGAGGSSGGTSGNLGNNAADSTFGTTFLVAGGGSGSVSSTAPGAGGSASIGAGATGLALPGAPGGPGLLSSSAFAGSGANGGSSAFGGAGSGGDVPHGLVANPGATNTGGGGGGGGAPSSAGAAAGAGGGSGGYVCAIVPSPSSTYPYSVGGGGSGGSAGAGTGSGGGAGGSGVILVEEFYQ